MTAERAPRINARLPEATARKVAYLERRTGMSATALVIASLERYYDEVLAAETGTAHLLADFVGCAEGPADLSSTYKDELTRSLSRKHG